MGESSIAESSSIDNRRGVYNACPTKLGIDLSIVDGVPPQSGPGLSSAFAIVSFEDILLIPSFLELTADNL